MATATITITPTTVARRSQDFFLLENKGVLEELLRLE